MAFLGYINDMQSKLEEANVSKQWRAMDERIDEQFGRNGNGSIHTIRAAGGMFGGH